MYACRYAPTAVEALLQPLSPKQATQAILATTKGWNALMIACRYAPTAVNALLQPLSPEQATTAILATNEYGWNTLMWACRYAPEEVMPMLSNLSSEQITDAMMVVDLRHFIALVHRYRKCRTAVEDIEKLSAMEAAKAITALFQ